MEGFLLLAVVVWGVALSPVAVWALVLSRRFSTLEQRLASLESRQTAPGWSAPPVPAPAPAPEAEPAPAEAPPRVEPRPEPIQAAAMAPKAVVAAPPEVPKVPTEPRPALGAVLSRWLAQNGLAWMGGAALTLGGLFLVVYAAERGFFTPQLRVLAAGATGAVMILASEWIRRQKNAPGGRHLLAAALAAGAGAATIYGAVWAAHSLYGLLPLAVAAVLITLVSAGLLGLSLLHGEALAVLAVIGAFAVPAVTGRTGWSAGDLDRFLVILILTGSAAAGVRRWAWAGLAVLAEAFAWSLEGLANDQHLQAELTVGATAIGAALPVFWRPRPAREEGVPGGRLRLQAEIVVWATSAASILLWAAAATRGDQSGTIVLLSSVLAVAGAAMAAAGLVRPLCYAGPALAPAIGVALAAMVGTAHPTLTAAVLIFVLAMVVAGAGLVFGLARPGARTALVGAGGPGAAALATVAWMAFRQGDAAPSWVLPLAGAALLSAGAWLLARRVEAREADRGLALWIAGTAELAFLTIQAAAPAHLAPALHGLLALALAVLARRLGWSGLSQTAVAGGLVVLATMLRPAFVGDALAKAMRPVTLAVVTAAAAVELFLAGRLLRPKITRDAEALGVWSLMALLMGGFLLIHRLADSVANPGVGALLEAGLRTDVALAAALVLYQRARDDEGPIARWRRLGLLWIAVAHGVWLQLLFLNPWWGGGEPPLGPPLLDTLALSYLAPAGLLALIARERRRTPLRWRRLAAVFSLAFGLVWVVLEIRRGFHGADLSRGVIERAEACGYALVLLLTARGLWRVRAKPSADAATSYLGEAAPAFGAAAVLVGAYVFCGYASPWWGALVEPLHGAGEALLLLAGYAAGMLATLWLEKVPAPERWRRLGPATLTVAMAELFVLVTLVVRWGFRGAAMHAAGAHESIETWTFSAVWAVFGLASLVTGGLRRDGLTLRWIGLVVLTGTLAKVLVFDMERLSGMIRAASFLAVGALLIFGALAARRLDAGGGFFLIRAKPGSRPG
jgi:uncharacterized membrane protein